MSTDYKGIDYGLKKTNINLETGIRFGVIPINSGCMQAWCDSSEPLYTKACPYCGEEFEQELGSLPFDCPHCKHTLEENDFDNAEPYSFVYEEEGYKCQSDGRGDIFIFKSPYFTYAQFCSPCTPGACYLNNSLSKPDPDNRCYCFGHDWFEDCKAPYPVYSVETGKIVDPE